jgi:hypothetical protein
MSNVQKELAIFKKFGFEIPPVGVKYLAAKPEGIKKLDRKVSIHPVRIAFQSLKE